MLQVTVHEIGAPVTVAEHARKPPRAAGAVAVQVPVPRGTPVAEQVAGGAGAHWAEPVTVPGPLTWTVTVTVGASHLIGMVHVLVAGPTMPPLSWQRPAADAGFAGKTMAKPMAANRTKILDSRTVLPSRPRHPCWALPVSTFANAARIADPE